jgi:ABC-type transporter Mla maintaining outer membrane lipid asymmetry ATPase subunit MlaF
MFIRAPRTVHHQPLSYRSAHTRFMMLSDGRLYFEGSAAELRASGDRYLREFLFMTLPRW